MVPCCGISFIVALLFVKQNSLVRDDDEKRKAEGKAWAAERKGKHATVEHAAEQAAEMEAEAQGVTEQPRMERQQGQDHDRNA